MINSLADVQLIGKSLGLTLPNASWVFIQAPPKTPIVTPPDPH
jgi:hypothetical protein